MPTVAFAQSQVDEPKPARISGRVLDKLGKPVPNAVVRADQFKSEPAAWTDVNGVFHFETATPRSLQLFVTAPGFGVLRKTVEAKAAGSLELGDIVLEVGCLECTFIEPVDALECCGNQKEPIQIGLCDLTKRPERFHGKVVEVRTAVRPFGVDAPTVLFDRSCPQTVLLNFPDARMEMWDRFPDGPMETEDRALLELLIQIRKHQPVEATVVGKFQVHLVVFGSQYLMLDLQRVSNIVSESGRNPK
jgi:hypothetical protein